MRYLQKLQVKKHLFFLKKNTFYFKISTTQREEAATTVTEEDWGNSFAAQF